MASKIEDASLWAVEAYLIVIIDKGSLKRAVGEVISGCSFEHVDLEIAGCSGPKVPIVSLKVRLEVAAV